MTKRDLLHIVGYLSLVAAIIWNPNRCKCDCKCGQPAAAQSPIPGTSAKTEVPKKADPKTPLPIVDPSVADPTAESLLLAKLKSENYQFIAGHPYKRRTANRTYSHMTKYAKERRKPKPKKKTYYKKKQPTKKSYSTKSRSTSSWKKKTYSAPKKSTYTAPKKTYYSAPKKKPN